MITDKDVNLLKFTEEEIDDKRIKQALCALIGSIYSGAFNDLHSDMCDFAKADSARILERIKDKN